MCLCVLLQSSERVGGESKEEAALYGVLAGNVGRVLPLCASWEDATWALTRRSACNASRELCKGPSVILRHFAMREGG